MLRPAVTVCLLLCAGLLPRPGRADQYLPIPLVWHRAPAEDASFFFLDYRHVPGRSYGLRFYSYFTAPFIPARWRGYVKCTLQGRLSIASNFDDYDGFFRRERRYFRRMDRALTDIRDEFTRLEAELEEAGNTADSEEARRLREQLEPLQELLREMEDSPASVLDFDFYYRFEEKMDELRGSEAWEAIEAEYGISGTGDNIRTYAAGITADLATVSDDLRALNLAPFYARTGWELRLAVHWFFGKVPSEKYPERMREWAARLRERM